MQIKIEDVEQAILSTYKSYGLQSALDQSNKILRLAEKPGPQSRLQRNLIKGELAEITLTCQLLELQRILGYPTHLIKSLYIQDTVTNQVTQLDVTFITPKRIYFIECKSYSGSNKVAKAQCQIYRDSTQIHDVFEQNKLHVNIFNHRYGCYTFKKTKPYKILLYDYSTSPIVDLRTQVNKVLCPILNEETCLKWILKDLQGTNTQAVDCNRLISEISSDLKQNGDYYIAEHKRQLKY